jgi:mutator protein MutT
VHAGERVLIAKRPAEGQWGGLWEFPSTRLRPGDEPRQALAEHLLRTLGVELEVGECLTQFAYGVMNRRVELTVHRCRQTGGEVAPTWHDEARWALAGELEALAMPSPHRTVADLLVGAR